MFPTSFFLVDQPKSILDECIYNVGGLNRFVRCLPRIRSGRQTEFTRIQRKTIILLKIKTLKSKIGFHFLARRTINSFYSCLFVYMTHSVYAHLSACHRWSPGLPSSSHPHHQTTSGLAQMEDGLEDLTRGTQHAYALRQASYSNL